jgi:hypothetical protein
MRGYSSVGGQGWALRSGETGRLEYRDHGLGSAGRPDGYLISRAGPPGQRVRNS